MARGFGRAGLARMCCGLAIIALMSACVLPGAAYAELALAAVTDAFGARSGEPWTIRELCLDQVMHVTDQTVVVTTLTGDESRVAGGDPFSWRGFGMGCACDGVG